MRFHQFGALAALLLAPVAVAQADVQWEHVVTVRVSTLKDPIGKLTMEQYFTAQRHRVDMDFDFQGMAQGAALGSLTPPGPLSALPGNNRSCAVMPPKKFDVTSITRYDDDTVLSYSSLDKTCYSDTIETMLSKMRFDPWKTLAPELSAKQPPSFTQEQRERLGAEYRAATQPILKSVMRVYFRKLDNPRTFNGIVAHGYRLSTLVNAGGFKHVDAQWMKVSYEWWLADPMPGDDAVASVQKLGLDKYHNLGFSFPTASLWLNELIPVLWACAPDETHQAFATVLPPDGSFTGTPVAMYASVNLPPMARAMSGDMHIEMLLTKRDTSALPANLFDASADYTKKPFIAPWDELQKALKGKFKLPTSLAMGMSWQAWRECSRKMKTISPFTPSF